jgi:hypothetical protein
LYRAICALDRRFLLEPEIAGIFAVLARTISEFFPKRTRSSETAWITVIDFNDHPDTTFEDVMMIVAVARARVRPRLPRNPP